MGKETSNHKNATPRNTKPYDVSHSFVRKVANRVSGYFGGLFATPETREEASQVAGPSAEAQETGGDVYLTPPTTSLTEIDVTRNHLLTHRRREVTEPIAGTSGHQQGFVKVDNSHRGSDVFSPKPGGLQNKFLWLDDGSGVKQSIVSSFDCFESSLERSLGGGDDQIAGTSGIAQKFHPYDNRQGDNDQLASRTSGLGQKFSRYDRCVKAPRYESAESKGDDRSESSESTSGCSSLVPQADRMSQLAFVSSSRRKSLALDEKLSYARQLKQSRSSMYLNKSCSVQAETPRPSRTPSFDISAYGKPILNKSVRETMLTSPFYTGQTTFGGSSARRGSLGPSPILQRSQIVVKPAARDREGLNMSHTAKRILAALEEFSTPLNDARRIPTPAPPLAAKRPSYDSTGSSAPKRPALAIPTVADLLKMRRLEQIQETTTMARKVARAARKPSPPRRSGKIVTKMKDREVPLDDPPPSAPLLPKAPLQCSSLPKFDLQLPPPAPSTIPDFFFTEPVVVDHTAASSSVTPSVNFSFSSPVPVSGYVPVKIMSELSALMTPDAISKLKRKSDGGKSNVAPVAAPQLATGSVTEVLGKSATTATHTELVSQSQSSFEGKEKPASDLSSYDSRNVSSSVGSTTCATPKPAQTQPTLPLFPIGFGNNFKPVAGSWTCDSCMLRNTASDTKCVACEEPKPGATTANGPKTDVSWKCVVCLMANKAMVGQCTKCGTTRPSGPLNTESKASFNFGLCGGYFFGNEKTSAGGKAVPNGPESKCAVKPSLSVNTSVGKFTFGIPASSQQKPETPTMNQNSDETDKSVTCVIETKDSNSPAAGTASSSSLVTPTSFTFGIPATSVAVVSVPSKPAVAQAFGINGTVLGKANDSSKLLTSHSTSLVFPASSATQTVVTPTVTSNVTSVLSEPSATPTPAFVSENSNTTLPSDFTFGAQTSSEAKTPALPIKVGGGFTFGASPSTAFVSSSSIITPSESKSTTGLGLTTSMSAPAFGVQSHVTSSALPTAFEADMTASKPFVFGSTSATPTPGFSAGSLTAPSSFGGSSSTSGLTFGTPSSTPTSIVQASSVPAFGSSTGSSNLAFGASLRPSTPAFGASSGTSAHGFGAPSGAGTRAFGVTSSAPTFGASTVVSTFGAAPGAVASTFGTSSGSNLNFGTPSGASTSAFGNPQVSTTSFGAPSSATTPAFGTPSGSSALPFGSSMPMFGPSSAPHFGQSSAGTPFGGPSSAPVAPAFGATPSQPTFGSTSAPPTVASASPFQFGSSNAAAPAAAAASFSLTVPSSFNFTGGQTPTFSADPTSAGPEPRRRIIRAMRRTQR